MSFRYVTIADHEGLRQVISFITQMESIGVKIIVTGIKEQLRKKIEEIECLSEEYVKRSWVSI